jgi:hypothetical protein
LVLAMLFGTVALVETRLEDWAAGTDTATTAIASTARTQLARRADTSLDLARLNAW